MGLINFSTDGSGKWWKTEWKEQCPHKSLFGKCQGVDGHKGVHWSYNEHGSFCYKDNEADSSENGCSGSIPPDHKNYIAPLEMAKHYYMTHHTSKEINDLEVIARLERGELLDGESINRPVGDLHPELMKEIMKRSREATGSNGKPKVGDT